MSYNDRTLQLVDSLVLTYPVPMPKGKGLTGSEADSSSTCGASPLCSWDVSTSSLRTSQLSLFGNRDSILYSERLPKAGYMTASGNVYPLKKLALGTKETGGGRSAQGERYWPTPTVCGNSNREELSAKAGDGLATAVERDAGRIWPTPVAWTDENREKWEQRKKEGLSSWKAQGRGATLSTAVKQDARKKWPTPTASDDKKGYSRNVEQGRLRDAAVMWPTICAAQYRGCGPLGSKSYEHRLDRGYLDARVIEAEQTSGKLNPEWVEALMGYPVGYTLPEGEPDHRLLDPSSWADGTWEEGIPRLSTENNRRTKRLKALGNSVVPQCCYELFGRLADHIIRTNRGTDEEDDRD